MTSSGQHPSDKNDYTFLDELTVEELEELLHAGDLSKDSDSTLQDKIVEAILKKERESPTGRIASIDQAWSDFTNYYNTYESLNHSLYFSEEDSPYGAPDNKNTPSNNQKRSGFRLYRVLVVAAIVAILMVFLVPTALGFESIFEMIGTWTDNVFHFESPSDELENMSDADLLSKQPREVSNYTNLQEAFDAYEISDPEVPTKIPKDYSLESVTIYEIPHLGETHFNAFYTQGESSFTIRCNLYNNYKDRIYFYEKDNNDVKKISINDLTFYLFTNNESNVVTWQSGLAEYSIDGDLTVDELNSMINSIM